MRKEVRDLRRGRKTQSSIPRGGNTTSIYGSAVLMITLSSPFRLQHIIVCASHLVMGPDSIAQLGPPSHGGLPSSSGDPVVYPPPPTERYEPIYNSRGPRPEPISSDRSPFRLAQPKCTIWLLSRGCRRWTKRSCRSQPCHKSPYLAGPYQ